MISIKFTHFLFLSLLWLKRVFSLLTHLVLLEKQKKRVEVQKQNLDEILNRSTHCNKAISGKSRTGEIPNNARTYTRVVRVNR